MSKTITTFPNEGKRTAKTIHYDMSEIELKNVRVYRIYHCGYCGRVLSNQALSNAKCNECGLDLS